MAYLGFHKGGKAKCLLATGAHTKGGPNFVFLILSMVKNTIFAKGGHGPNPPPKYATGLAVVCEINTSNMKAFISFLSMIAIIISSVETISVGGEIFEAFENDSSAGDMICR